MFREVGGLPQSDLARQSRRRVFTRYQGRQTEEAHQKKGKKESPDHESNGVPWFPTTTWGGLTREHRKRYRATTRPCGLLRNKSRFGVLLVVAPSFLETCCCCLLLGGNGSSIYGGRCHRLVLEVEGNKDRMKSVLI